MGYEARVILDSRSLYGARITSLVIKFPRVALAEFNTHRKWARNSASSRAIPISKMIKQVLDDPYVPEFTGAQKGMQGTDKSEDIDWQIAQKARHFAMRDLAVEMVGNMAADGVHKQDANRYLEPYLWHEVLVTGTWDCWPNVFDLRCDVHAYPPMMRVTDAIWDALASSEPSLEYGWHLPFISLEELDSGMPILELAKISAARSARISYLTHEGKRDPVEDLMLFDKLIGSRHPSPFEHVAQPLTNPHERSGPFDGWRQYRKSSILRELGFEECVTDMAQVQRKLIAQRPDRQFMWEMMPTKGPADWGGGL